MRLHTRSRITHGSKTPLLPYPGTDPYIGNVALLMHMDDAQFTDVKGHTVTRVGASLNPGYFPIGDAPYSGSLRLGGSGYLAIPLDATLDAGTGDFTFELRFKRDKLPSHWDNITLFSTVGASSGYTYRLYTSSTNLMWDVGGSNICWVTGYNIPGGTWGHCSISRVSGKWYLAVNGVRKTYSTKYGTYNLSPRGSLYIGGQGDGAYGSINGWIDEFRYTVGQSRYGDSNYEVPTYAFPNQ